jgi:hypothetical protein
VVGGAVITTPGLAVTVRVGVTVVVTSRLAVTVLVGVTVVVTSRLAVTVRVGVTVLTTAGLAVTVVVGVTVLTTAGLAVTVLVGVTVVVTPGLAVIGVGVPVVVTASLEPVGSDAVLRRSESMIDKGTAVTRTTAHSHRQCRCTVVLRALNGALRSAWSVGRSAARLELGHSWYADRLFEMLHEVLQERLLPRGR